MEWKKLIGEIYDNTKIYLVDGDYVRDNVCVNKETQFVEGGHGYVYDWIPKDEIWVEEMINKEDQAKNGMHEIYEYTLMKYIKEEYNDAHAKTLTVENLVRKLSNEGIKSKETNEKRGINKMSLLTRMYEGSGSIGQCFRHSKSFENFVELLHLSPNRFTFDKIKKELGDNVIDGYKKIYDRMRSESGRSY
jgi:hypothetical protein